VVDELLAELATAVRHYVAPEHRDATVVTVAGRLLDLARTAGAGSDTQLQLVRAVAAHAVTDDQLDAVAALLDGRERLEGLAVDTDLRWALLTALVAAGRAGDAEIDGELARDNTAAGARAAATARAARPTPEAKQAAWASVVESDELSNAIQASVIAGFGRVHDRSLLEPFVEPYFTALNGVWATRTPHTARRITIWLYPALLAGPALVQRTDQFLASLGDDMATLRRLTLENRDGVVRALRAQERDRQP
jgi:aminopeptidase N